MAFLHSCDPEYLLVTRAKSRLEAVDQSTSPFLGAGQAFGMIHDALNGEDGAGVVFAEDAGEMELLETPLTETEKSEILRQGKLLKQTREEDLRQIEEEYEKARVRYKAFAEQGDWGRAGKAECEMGRLRAKKDAVENRQLTDTPTNIQNKQYNFTPEGKLKLAGYYTRNYNGDGSSLPRIVLRYSGERKNYRLRYIEEPENSLVPTYIHELYHAYVDHDLKQTSDDIKYAEEPIVEYAMLKTLEHMGEEYEEDLYDALCNTEEMKLTPGLAHYAFAYYLFKNCADVDWVGLLRKAKYQIDSNSDAYKELKGYLGRVYPYGKEKQVAKCLKDLLMNPQGNKKPNKQENKMADSEQFDDFKEASSASDYVNPEITKVFDKELSDVEEFKVDFDETLEMSDDPKAVLTDTVVGYIQGLGDVNQVNQCSYDNGNGVALDGWAYNGDEDLTSIDLFLTVYVDPDKSSKISASELDRHFNWLYRFYEQSLSGVMLGKLSDDSKSDIYQVADIIHSANKVDRVRLFLMTNAIAPADYDKSNSEIGDGTVCEYVIWDAKRLMRQNDIMKGKSSIVVDFDADYNSPLSCIKMPDISENVECYLCAISGMILAQIYHKYHQQILEQNVRTFLQFKGASNKGIRDTMIGHKATNVEKLKGVEDVEAEPDMFFAYNNGISTTASDIEVRTTENGLEIVKIKDWQIVNGGQTTASISAVLSMKNVDYSRLSKIYVPMKVSRIKDKEKLTEIVHKISKFANTQSVVKKSDFNINEPFLVDLEQQSRQEWVKNSAGKPVSKWFFERTRGQYLDKANRNPTKAAEREFYAEYPKSQMFDKTTLSKFAMAWLCNPSSVCKGGENNYGIFCAKMKAGNTRFDTDNYHRMIAKGILFKAIDAYYGKEGLDLPGYKSNMVAYTLSALAHLTKKKLDLAKIWNEQCVISMPVYNEMTIDVYSIYAKLLQGQQHVTYKVKQVYKTDDGKLKKRYEAKDIPPEDLNAIKATVLYKTMELVKEIEPDIWKHVVDVPAGNNINEWTKSTRCWDVLKANLDNAGYSIPTDILSASSNGEDGGVVVTPAQQKVIDAVVSLGADVWASLHQWSKNNEVLTPVQIAFIGNLPILIKKGKQITYKQAKYALDLYEKAENAGWKN